MNFKKMFSLLKRCYPNIKPFMRQNIAFITTTEIVVLLSLFIPLGIRYLIDTIITDKRWDMFPHFAGVMVVLVVFSKVLSIATNILYGRFSSNIEAKARDSLFSCVLKKDISFFNNVCDGDIVDRLMRSPEQLHTIPSIYLERLISSVCTLLVVSFIIFSIHPAMAIFSLLTVPIFIFIHLKTRSLFFSQVQMAREESAKLTDFYMSAVRNIKQIKNHCSECDEQIASQEKNGNIKSLSFKYSMTGAFISNGTQIVTQLNQLLVLIYGASQINQGNLTVGTLVAFYSYLELLYQPIISIIQALSDMSNSLVGMERFLEYYNHEHEENYENEGLNKILSNSIDFYNVSFSFDKQVILEDISFHIDAGDKVLLCGKSGIGKSTIAALIKRFYPCNEGRIEIGGRQIQGYNLYVLRKNIAYMTQEDFFYSTTVRENFKRINPSITDLEVEHLLRLVHLYDDIFGLGKEGLETSLEKNAVSFSGGQRRRISLAMLLASPASIVILDEPFVGIDMDTQQIIWSNIRDRFHNKTVIIIDHNFLDKEYFNTILEVNSSHDIIHRRNNL